MTGSRPLRVRLVATGLIVLCGGLFLYGVQRGAYRATADGARYVGIGRYDSRVLAQHRIDQMRKEFTDRVPSGAWIRLVDPVRPGTYWAVMLGEFAALNGVRVAEPAGFAVAVVEDGSDPFGVRLLVEPLR